jgi:hypothetical protein
MCCLTHAIGSVPQFYDRADIPSRSFLQAFASATKHKTRAWSMIAPSLTHTLSAITKPEQQSAKQSCQHVNSWAVVPSMADSHPNTEPPRACQSCNSRKIRCDKTEPCSACLRSGRSCVYPPAGPRVRRTRRAIFSDMTKRIASLEKSLAQAKTQPCRDTEQTATPQSSTPSSLTHASIDVPLGGGDVLLRNGASTQYINESFIARVIDKVCCGKPICHHSPAHERIGTRSTNGHIKYRAHITTVEFPFQRFGHLLRPEPFRITAVAAPIASHCAQTMEHL